MNGIDERLEKLKAIQQQIADLQAVGYAFKEELRVGPTRLRDLCFFKRKSTISIFKGKGQWVCGHDITITIPDSLKSLLIAEIEKQIVALREQGASV